jgi:hypothetical protein
MLVILLTRPSTLEGLFDCAPRLRESVRALPYEELERHVELHCGVVVFSDLERLTDAELEAARDLAAQLESHAPRLRVLNDPRRTLRRYDLLRRLAERGVNDFRAFRLSELPPNVRFPAFLRVEDDHKGPRTELLTTREALDEHVARLTALGRDLSQILLVEFCDVSDDDGLFHKYEAWVIDGEVLPGSVIFSERWCIKLDSENVFRESIPAVEREHFERNPHAERMREIAELVGAEYGRFDYGVKDGRIQVWEFNTNPVVTREYHIELPERIELLYALHERIAGALGRLAAAHADVRLPLEVPPGTFEPHGLRRSRVRR